MTTFARLTAAAVCTFALGAASATTITFDGFGGVNEDGTPDNGDAFTSYSEAGYTLMPTGGEVLVAKAVGNGIPAIYVPSDGTSAFGRFELTRGGGAFSLASIDIAAIVSNVNVTFTGMLGNATLYSFSSVVAGRAFTFGAPIMFDTVSAGFASAIGIDRLTVSFAGGGTSLTADNIVVNAVPAAVPEPASAALLALGLLGVVAAKRRRAA